MNAAHRLLLWCATQLQVEAPERWRSWLWRLFVLPPAGRSALPVDAQRVPDPLLWADGSRNESRRSRRYGEAMATTTPAASRTAGTSCPWRPAA